MILKNSFLTLNKYKQLFMKKPLGRPHIRMMSVENDVIIQSVKDKGVITLNRPKALNALNLSMANKLYPTLFQWQKEKTLVIIKGTGEKAFCAGGDVRAIVEAGLRGERLGHEFFRKEYSINGLIGNYSIPYIAFIDGIVMGGGVGLSVHGRYRVGTERSLFAMPETAIGLFPDVGGSYFLPRLSGKMGCFLALTGYRLKGSDVLHAGIATHYCESQKLPELEEALLKCENEQGMKNILDNFSNRNLADFTLAPHIDKINEYFASPSVEGILENLKNDKSDWADDTLKTLSKMSPTSLKVTLRELQLGANMDLQECLQMEYRIAINCLANKDFYEGVRALLIDKDQKPHWRPSALEQVSANLVNSHFKLVEGEEELKHKL